MDSAEESDAPANELEALVTDLSAIGPVIYVFGNGWLATHLVGGGTRPLFRGPSERRRCHVEHGDAESTWVLDVRLDQVERVRFSREVSQFSSSGQESLVVRFLADGDETTLHCFLGDIHEGRRLRPERLRAWEELRSRYGNRDESMVVDGSLQAAPVAA